MPAEALRVGKPIVFPRQHTHTSAWAGKLHEGQHSQSAKEYPLLCRAPYYPRNNLRMRTRLPFMLNVANYPPLVKDTENLGPRQSRGLQSFHKHFTIYSGGPRKLRFGYTQPAGQPSARALAARWLERREGWRRK